MSDITAQAFREAAGDWNDPHVNALLLAAAEQREQLDALLQLNEADNRTQAAYHEQIATLTAERDEARAKANDAIKELHDYQYQEDLCSRTE